MPLLTLERVSMAFGHLPLLDQVSFQIEPGDRAAIIGRNGAGKSTLLQIISGELAADRGTIWRPPHVQVARLVQDVPLSAARPVFDVVAEGLGELGALATAYHHAAAAVARHATPELLDRLGRLQHELEQRDGWRLEQRVEMILDRLALPLDARVEALSGGWRRRVLLARTLVAQPDVLLLDEPTNHLDIESITWLEGWLADYPGAIVFVTHDRAFLERLATRVVELDRGQLTSWGDYPTFLRKKEEWLANESVQQAKFDKKLAEEEAWLRQGIKARRTRNEGRVRALLAMRAERAARRDDVGTVRLQAERADPSGRLVFEVAGVSKSFDERDVLRDVSTRILRGDRIGLIGANGAGKTTFLRLLLGELMPDSGDVRVGANVAIAYYDQQREALDPEKTVFETVGDGSDTITVGGETRHVHGYLRDFLFEPERARSPVKALSGGERNRLLLARLFARPANVLVLDEPTNDLDLDTLELLEAQLVGWPGTLLLVSHDRRFLDNVVTSTIVFEGDGLLREYVGGYADWVRQRDAGRHLSEAASSSAAGGVAAAPERARQARAAAVETQAVPKRLSYHEQRELAALPGRIEALEAERRALDATIASPDFYKETAERIDATLTRVSELEAEIAATYARWDALDSRSS